MKKTIKELNNFLEGNFMAIDTYNDYIHRVEDKNIKAILQEIQQNHKEHATIITERIQNLGGVPVSNPGLKGSFAKMMKNIIGTDGTKDILKDALVGEQRGIETSKEILDGDLDKESLKIVKEILAHDEKHISILSDLLDKISDNKN